MPPLYRGFCPLVKPACHPVGVLPSRQDYANNVGVNIEMHVRAFETRGAVLPGPVVREIAGWWCEPGSALAWLVDTGAVDLRGAERELSQCQPRVPADRRDLAALSAYVRSVGDRGPVPGWA
jgi:hypothetical protein